MTEQAENQINGFDSKGFERARFVPRTVDVWVEALAEFFPQCPVCNGHGKIDEAGEACKNCRGAGTRAVITVRSLSGEEVARVREEVERNKAAGMVAEEARRAGAGEEAVRAVRLLLGVTGDNVPDEHARNIAMVHLGCMSPKVSHGQSLKMAQHFPVEHAALAQEITRLTGLGSALKKK